MQPPSTLRSQAPCQTQSPKHICEPAARIMEPVLMTQSRQACLWDRDFLTQPLWKECKAVWTGKAFHRKYCSAGGMGNDGCLGSGCPLMISDIKPGMCGAWRGGQKSAFRKRIWWWMDLSSAFTQSVIDGFVVLIRPSSPASMY